MIASNKKGEASEDLKYEKQMNKLEPWIKALYKQTEKDPNNPSGWSEWSIRPSKKVEYGFQGKEKITHLDGGNRQEYLNNLIKLEKNKDWEKFISSLPLIYPLSPPLPLSLTEEEKRFLLLANQVLGLELTEGEFLRMSSADRQGIYDQINGL